MNDCPLSLYLAPASALTEALAATETIVASLRARDLVAARAADARLSDVLGRYYDIDTFDDMATLGWAMAEAAGDRSPSAAGTVDYLAERFDVDPSDVATWASVPDEFLEDLRDAIANPE